MSAIINKKDFYTTKELADILKISKQSVLKRVHRENINAQKTGRDFIIFKKDINFKKLTAEIKH
ncbi:MAG: helix-turn-helix domain-containing protein [Candidatus Staskawiczbacteria bacterium]|nr:helix-turn-helix domain-containing protein [Candidatus Staskawiczbacteria bacterium]